MIVLWNFRNARHRIYGKVSNRKSCDSQDQRKTILCNSGDTIHSQSTGARVSRKRDGASGVYTPSTTKIERLTSIREWSTKRQIIIASQGDFLVVWRSVQNT